MVSFFLVLFLLAVVYSKKHSLNGTVYFNEQLNLFNLTLDVVDCNKGIACGIFQDTLNETGWSILNIKSDYKSTSISDYSRYYAAGYLEGALSSYEIFNYYTVAWDNFRVLVIPFEKELIEWHGEQTQWIKEQISLNPNNKLWIYMNNIMAQFNGLMDGYNFAASNIYNNQINQLNSFQFSLLNSVMDYLDVVETIITTNQTLKALFDAGNLHSKEWRDSFQNWQKMRGLHCSGLIKVTPTFDNLYFSHSTWISYYMMNRIYKHYIFKSTNIEYPTTQMSFSSYPGALNSLDDFYILNSGLAVMETTNDQFNVELWKHVNAQQLFTWMRVRVANQLSNSGPEWISYFEQYNSGTYNNQWMILDYKLFKVNEPLNDNLLWIAEQIPGNVSKMDVTNILERGYWASYNVPAIEYIYKESGNEANARIRGNAESYDLAPRARIFRRDANKISTLDDAKKLMRYNNYLKDPIENKNPVWSIMARGDLESPDQGQDVIQLFGGTDTKLANLTMLNNMEAIAKSGPTNDQTPTFTWKGQWEHKFHYGLPETYDFEWVTMEALLK